MTAAQPMTSRRCTATRADGSPCKAWAIRSTDPPRCNAHRNLPSWGAPEGNHNALKHGYYAACPDQQPALSPSRVYPEFIPSLSRGTRDHEGPRGTTRDLSKGGGNSLEDCTIEAVIDMLFHKQVALDSYIDQIMRTHQPSVLELSHLLKIHGQNASRLGRLLRDRRALGGDAADGLSGAIAQALEELSTELGTDLT